MRKVGAETRKTYQEKLDNGFFNRFMSGRGIEIGYQGYEPDVVPILDNCIGIELGQKGYNGVNIPYPDQTQDYVYSSHVLEHISDYKTSIKEWFRVLKPGGYLIIIVPHQWLYEKKECLPSQFNGDHKRFYTAASLLAEIEDCLEINTFRIRHLRENDEGHNYSDPPNVHGKWLYEIELVIQKL